MSKANRKMRRVEKKKDKKVKKERPEVRVAQYNQAMLLNLQTQIDAINDRLNSVIENRFQFVAIDNIKENVQITVHSEHDAGDVFEVLACCVGELYPKLD